MKTFSVRFWTRYRSLRFGQKVTARQFSTTVDVEEIAKFNLQAQSWWDPNGPAAPLHRLNPVRVAFVRAAIESRMAQLGTARSKNASPLHGVSVVDVGCGAGLVTEPLARLGANVLGADMSVDGINAARSHAATDPILVKRRSLRYEVCTAEDLSRTGNSFDTVLALEIIEHVANPAGFLKECATLVKPGGLLILSTLNRTAASYALGIVAAERVLRWLPKGTHDWRRFPTPSEIASVLESDTDLLCDEVVGLSFNPFSNRFSITGDTSVNYMLTAIKPLLPPPRQQSVATEAHVPVSKPV